METLESILQLVTPSCFMTMIDLVEAYLMIYIHKDNHCYLKFYLNGKLLQYICLPFGLTSSPRIFSKLMKVVVSTLRKRDYIVCFYLDDRGQKGDTYSKCLEACEATYNLLLELGFLPNDKKSSLILCLEVLRHIIDSGIRKHIPYKACFHSQQNRIKTSPKITCNK